MRKIGEVGVMDKPVPEPGPNDAIVRTTAALICTSDSHTVRGAIGDRHDLTLGHESVAVALGRAASAEETHATLEALANPLPRRVLQRLAEGPPTFGG
jgi:threonine dehydrogenase-like Zn-dependent dehydrogenase